MPACFKEGLRHDGLGAVVAELARLSMTASRRLQLAAEDTGAIGIAIRRWRRQTESTDFGQPTAHRAPPLARPSVGRARWQLELIRVRAGESADFEPAMPRVISLFFPAWPTDRLRRALGQSAPSAETPIVMLGRQGNRRLVLAADAAARAAGLRVGMPASKAQVLVPGLQSFDLDPAGDAEALERMALWSLRYAPIVAADSPDGLIIDTTGADHLHGGEETMLEGLVSRIAASGIEARAAVADSWGAAHGRGSAALAFIHRPTKPRRQSSSCALSNAAVHKVNATTPAGRNLCVRD